MKKILIKKALAISKKDRLLNKLDILVENGRISRISNSIEPSKNWKTIKAEKLWLTPGIIDTHVHSRVPGGENKEDFKSLTRAALSGGITSVLLMPNTEPPTDENLLPFLKKKAAAETALNIFFACAITRQRKGKLPVNFDKAVKAGASAFTDDGSWTSSSSAMLKALEYSTKTKIPVLSHCQLEGFNGAVNKGTVSKKLGLKGQPDWAEYKAALRDIKLAVQTSGRLHIQHVSCAKTANIIADINSPSITAETCPHYFFFTQEDLLPLDANFKMNPPLRTKKDRKEIIKALKKNHISIIASDHAPHLQKDKSAGLEKAPFGVIGLETMLSASISALYHENNLPIDEIIEKMTSAPAALLNLENKGVLRPGADADLAIIDPELEWLPEKFYSKSANSPFIGKKLKGKALITILKGRIVYEKGKFYL